MSDENASDELPEYTWEHIRFLLALGGRGNLVLATNDARRHLVWFARLRGVKVGRGTDRNWSLPGAIRRLAQEGTISVTQRDELIAAVDTRDDEIHRNRRPSDDDLLRAVQTIATVCEPRAQHMQAADTKSEAIQKKRGSWWQVALSVISEIEAANARVEDRERQRLGDVEYERRRANTIREREEAEIAKNAAKEAARKRAEIEASAEAERERRRKEPSGLIYIAVLGFLAAGVIYTNRKSNVPTIATRDTESEPHTTAPDAGALDAAASSHFISTMNDGSAHVHVEPTGSIRSEPHRTNVSRVQRRDRPDDRSATPSSSGHANSPSNHQYEEVIPKYFLTHTPASDLKIIRRFALNEDGFWAILCVLEWDKRNSNPKIFCVDYITCYAEENCAGVASGFWSWRNKASGHND